MFSKNVNRAIIIAVLVCLAAALSACGKKKEAPAPEPAKKEVAEPEPLVNPLTGSEKYRQAAAETRVVGFVVENHPDARPQIGMDDKKYSPDIILEGEVEGGISRMFWFFADQKKLPKVIGPLRSARPPFIRFSKFWDAIFIHWGMSHSEGGYVGANDVFKQEHVTHINAMTFEDKAGAFGRDTSSGKSLEHTGRAYGKKIPKALKEKNVRNKPRKFTELKWNDKPKKMSNKSCGELTVTFSRVSGSTTWKYDKKSKTYKTSNFENNTKRDNVIILFDKTDYITNAEYQGHGVTYCDYKLSGGKGYVASRGTFTKIKWKKKGKKLYLYKTEKKPVETVEAEESAESAKDEMEEEPKYEIIEHEFKLNKGKSYIGYASSNNGGKVEIKKIKKD